MKAKHMSRPMYNHWKERLYVLTQTQDFRDYEKFRRNQQEKAWWEYSIGRKPRASFVGNRVKRVIDHHMECFIDLWPGSIY